MMIVHVTDVSRWGLYTKCMICMLQVGVHCAGIICTIACYGLVQYFLIVIVNMEYYIIIFIVCDWVFQIWIVSAEFGSSRFCWVQLSLFLCMSAVHGEYDWRSCSSLIVYSQFRYEFSTGIWSLKLVLGLEFSTGNLDWNPHICRCGQNMFFYNC